MPPLPMGHPSISSWIGHVSGVWLCICLGVCVGVCIVKRLSREDSSWHTCSVRTDAHNAVSEHSLLALHFSPSCSFPSLSLRDDAWAWVRFLLVLNADTLTLSFFLCSSFKTFSCFSFLFVDIPWYCNLLLTYCTFCKMKKKNFQVHKTLLHIV